MRSKSDDDFILHLRLPLGCIVELHVLSLQRKLTYTEETEVKDMDRHYFHLETTTHHQKTF